MYSIYWHIVQYCENLLTVSFEDFKLTEHAEWILEQRNEYKIFTRKLEGIYLLILKWEYKDNVKIDSMESSVNIPVGLDWLKIEWYGLLLNLTVRR